MGIRDKNIVLFISPEESNFWLGVTMTTMRQLIPEVASLLSMHPSDLAGYVLETLVSAGPMERGQWNRRNFCMDAGRAYVTQGNAADERVGIACSVAWSWLETNGLICKQPEGDEGWYVATPRGLEIRGHSKLAAVLTEDQLPLRFLHRSLLVHARPLYFQSRFDTAVFEAFKELEVAIRTAAKLGPELVGVQLASKAFHPEEGFLTDKSAEKGERVALMNLMTGALGSYKNPSSHRRVQISSDEARDMIMMASHLLNIVETRLLCS